ncbi:hypothetical protein BHYA_0715g00010 [Botrytis hyacinthi]|uniref:Major facilitator superfamily (MFS) profile domain-containing protein n=1 Tax=Botrytis hyacinthi TaxID=278943 RepID=A0A4Z1G3E5_9HELO|nr:hypothetical protein BHYA_0715g00010 [Botrytis hyacinthi]
MMAANNFRQAEIQTTEKESGEKPDEHWQAGSENTVTSQDEVNEKAPDPDGVVNERLDDPTLPQNWPVQKKFFNMAVPSVLCLVIALGASICTPAVPDIILGFGVSETIALIPLTTYTLGFALAPMLSAPISEIFGRMGAYKITPPLVALFSLGAGFSPNISALCILRFFAGFFGGASLPVVGGTAADLFHAKDRAVSVTFVMYTAFLGTALGPLIGGFITQRHHQFATIDGWKWSQWALAIMMIASWIPVFLLDETYLKVILARRKKKHEKQNSLPDMPKPPASQLLLRVIFITLLRPTKMLMTEPIVALTSLYAAFTFAVIFTFFASVPYVYTLVYDFDRGNTGLVFLGVCIGCTLGVPTMILLDKHFYQKAWYKIESEGRTGVVAPERRLLAAMIGGFGLPIGLFWFGWSAREDVHWIVPIIATIPCAWGNLCIFTSILLYLTDTYEALTAASAMAATGLLRYIFGGTFPLFITYMYNHLGIGWASSLLAFLSIILIPIPWILYRWGPRIRAASKLETIRVVGGDMEEA